MAINKVIYGNQTLIDLTGDTVDATKMLYGYKAHDRSGTQITGSCTYDSDTTDATATQSEILATKTAYVNGSKVTGNMTNNGGVSGTISTKDGQYSIAAGYHDGSGKVALDQTEKNKLIPGNIKAGISLFSVVGDYSGETVTAETKSATPYTTAQTVLPSSGYDYLSQVDIAAIAYTETSNTYGTTVTIGTVAP